MVNLKEHDLQTFSRETVQEWLLRIIKEQQNMSEINFSRVKSGFINWINHNQLLVIMCCLFCLSVRPASAQVAKTSDYYMLDKDLKPFMHLSFDKTGNAKVEIKDKAVIGKFIKSANDTSCYIFFSKKQDDYMLFRIDKTHPIMHYYFRDNFSTIKDVEKFQTDSLKKPQVMLQLLKDFPASRVKTLKAFGKITKPDVAKLKKKMLAVAAQNNVPKSSSFLDIKTNDAVVYMVLMENYIKSFSIFMGYKPPMNLEEYSLIYDNEP